MPIELSTATYRKIKNDQVYMASDIQSVASDSMFNLHLKNPSDSGRNLWVIDIDASGGGGFEHKIYPKFDTAPSGGSSAVLHPVLLNSDSVENSGVAEVNINVDFSSSHGHPVGVVGGNGGAVTSGGSSDHPAVVLEPGREVVVEAKNIGTESHRYGIHVMYFEAPTSTTEAQT